MSTTRTLKVLEVLFIFRLSVRRDAFLSELLCHSHQVSGVWVAETVGRNKKTKHHCISLTSGCNGDINQMLAFPCQEFELHLSVFNEPFTQLPHLLEKMLRLKPNLSDHHLQHTYQRGPPHNEVLWWMSFQVMTFCMPVVMEVPMVKIRRCSKARRSRPSTRFPSGLSGR